MNEFVNSFYHSEQSNASDESAATCDKDRLSMQSPLGCIAEAMMDPG